MFTKDSTIQEIQAELVKLTKNQCILFAADCARSVLHLFENKYPDDKRPRLAIEMAESLKYDSKIAYAACDASVDASDNAAYSALAAADNAAYSALAAANNAAYSAWAAANNANNVYAYYAWTSYSVWTVVTAGQLDIINSLYKYAYNLNLFQNSYKTPDVLNISKAIIIERDFASSKILADALEDAGCTDDDLLNHLRIDIIGLSDWVLFSLRQDAL